MDLFKKLDYLNETQSAAMAAIEAKAAEAQALSATDPFGAEKKKAEANQLLNDYSVVKRKSEETRSTLLGDLKNGNYLTYGFDSPDADTDLSPEGINRKTAKALSYIVGEPVDVTTGLDMATRAKVSFLRGPSVDEFLGQKYGPDNVKTVNVGGSPMRLVKDERGQWKAVNEMGASAKDAIVLASEVVPTIGGVLGGALGAGSTGGSPAGFAIGGAAGYTAAGTLQDQLARAVLGAGESFADSLGQRSLEGLAGAALEYGVSVPARQIAKRIGAAKIDDYYNIVRQNEDFLKSRGYDVNIASIAEGGRRKTGRLLQLAEDRPRSVIGQDVHLAVERLNAIKSKNIPAGQKPAAMYQATIDNLRQNMQMTADMVSLYDKKAGEALRRGINERIGKMVEGNLGVNVPGGLEPPSKLGEDLFRQLQIAKSNADKIKNDTYQPFYERANAEVSVDPVELAQAIEKDYYSSAIRSPQVDAQLADLRQRPLNAKRIQEIDAEIAKNPEPAIVERLNLEKAKLKELAGPLNAKQLDDQVALFAEAVPEGGAVGQTRKVGTATKAAGNIQSYRDSIYKDLGLLEDWNNATQVFRQRLGYNENAPGRFLKETLGKPDMDETKIVDTILSSPRQIQDTISALSLGDPGASAMLRNRLQNSYLQKIGVASRYNKTPDSFSFDPEVVRSLWGTNWKGEVNEVYGDRMVQKLQQLQSVVQKQKLDPSKITPDDITELSTVLSKDSVDEFVSNLSKRVQQQMEVDKIKQNSLMDIALKGHREVIHSGEFPAAMWNSNADHVGKVLAQMPPADQAMLRGDMVEHLFANYPITGKHGVHGEALWDGAALLRDWAKNPKREAVVRRVIGDELTDEIKSASTLMRVLDTTPSGQVGSMGGGVINEGGWKLYLAAKRITHGLENTFLSAAYRAGKLSPFLKKLANKEISPEQYKKNLTQMMIQISAGSRGIEALTSSGRYNPEWSAWLGANLGTLSEETQKYQEKYGVESRTK